MKENVAVYFRCSTDKQDNSIADQRRIIAEHAIKNAMQITTWFDKDEGKSGTSFEKRPDFMKMVKIVESGKNDFTRILVYDVDRWGRPIDPDESTYWEYHFKRYGVQVTYISDESINDNSLAGRLTKKIKQELATEESRKQSLRVRERSKLRAAEGFRVGGYAPYGYKRLLVEANGTPIKVLEHGERKYEKHQRVILTPGNPEEIKVIKRIFMLRTKGYGYKSIANMLNERNTPSPGKLRGNIKRETKWSAGSIRSIIRNPVYKGDWTYNRQVRGNWVKDETPDIYFHPVSEHINHKNSHSGLISTEQFDQANSIRNYQPGRQTVYRNGRSAYLLSGLIKCKSCGYCFQGHIHRNKYGEWRYYEDGGFYSRGSSVCSSFHIPKELIESFVIKEIKRKVFSAVNISRLESLIEQRLIAYKSLTPDNSRIAKLEGELADVIGRLENIKDGIEKGLPMDFIGDRITMLERRKQELEAEKTSLQKKVGNGIDANEFRRSTYNYLDEFDSAFQNASNIKKKELLHAFVNRIEIDKSQGVATCYIHKIPSEVKVYQCRRSDLNRHDVAIGGF